MGRLARLSAARQPGVVRAYVEAAKEIFPTVFSPDCCLNGTRVCIEALAMHGVNAKPLVVDMIAANSAANRMFDEHGGWATAEEDIRRWMAEGAWVVTVDGTHPTDVSGWAHHLVASTSQLIIDSALGQASRPEKNIHLPWCAAFPRSTFGATTDSIVYDAPDGGTVGFRARRDVVDFRHLPGFQPHRYNMEIAAAVANKMSDLMNKERT